MNEIILDPGPRGGTYKDLVPDPNVPDPMCMDPDPKVGSIPALFGTEGFEYSG